MEFSLRWLADYVDLPAGPEGPLHLAKRLTGAGFAVDGLAPHGDDPGNLVIDIDVTTNRTDAMNHFGLAREVAVLYDRPLRAPASVPAEGAERAEEAARIDIQDPIGCPRYTARVIRGVKVGPSPDWLKARLEAIGLRPISNVVDVTNFILWELGQPLHAFDLAKLAGGRIVVRKAEAGETLVTLDGVERKLDPEMLVIADAERAVALGGVMGGLDSEVTAGTTDLLLESAHFDRKVVRRTARALGMHTDASHRFERGADPEICALAVSRAARLIAEIAGGTVLAGTLDVRAGDRVWHRQGRLELAKLNAFAGVEIAAADAERWLTGLGFALAADGEAEETGAAGVAWKVTVPSWRHYDFEPRPTGEIYPADLYEEVIRIHGFDAIPAALPAVAGADAPRTPAQIRREKVRRLLAASGFTESIHFAFLAPEAEASLPNLRPETPALRLANPLSEQYAVLRRSLSPNLVETARFNQRRGAGSVRLFEVATVFFGQGNAIPEQPEHVALVCGGRVGNEWQGERELDFFDLKGALEVLFEGFGALISAKPAELAGLLAGSSAELALDGVRVGYLGRVEAEEGYPLFVAELALEALAVSGAMLQVEVPSRYPGIAVDFTLTHPLSTAWSDIEAAIGELAPPTLVGHGLKVRYRGQGVPEGAVNTTISFLYQARDRSLTQEEVNERQFALCRELERRFGWKG